MNFTVWGMTGSLATERESAQDFAEERLWFWIRSIDETCNRFIESSEISRINSRSSSVVTLSPLMERVLAKALHNAQITEGLCDPTVLPSLLALGYDADYDLIAQRPDFQARVPQRPAGAHSLVLNSEDHTLTLPEGCQLDLGATAKAMTTDLVADDLMNVCGVVVELGGDVSLRGRGPSGPWVTAITDSLVLRGDEPKVSFTNGGIATSSSTVRTWTANGGQVNHIIDPRTGSFATSTYATASVSAVDCATANAFATAALLWGDDAPYYIAQAGWSARLVRHDGAVDFVGGWPQDQRTCA